MLLWSKSDTVHQQQIEVKGTVYPFKWAGCLMDSYRLNNYYNISPILILKKYWYWFQEGLDPDPHFL